MMPSRLEAVDSPVPRRAAVTVMPAVPNKPIARMIMPIMISSTATPLRFERAAFFRVVVVMSSSVDRHAAESRPGNRELPDEAAVREGKGECGRADAVRKDLHRGRRHRHGVE